MRLLTEYLGSMAFDRQKRNLRLWRRERGDLHQRQGFQPSQPHGSADLRRHGRGRLLLRRRRLDGFPTCWKDIGANDTVVTTSCFFDSFGQMIGVKVEDASQNTIADFLRACDYSSDPLYTGHAYRTAGTAESQSTQGG